MPVDPLSASSTLPLARAGRSGLQSPGPEASRGGATAATGSFSDSLTGLLTSVDASAGEANNAIANMVRGTGDVHDAMIALQRAETTLQLTVQVRNKLVQAYQDIMRMPI
jgi:flagellar hook-basal body complex protein FliE